MSTKAVSDAELQRTIDVLARHGGNQLRAALELGIARQTLQARVEKATTRGLQVGTTPFVDVPDDAEYEKLQAKLKFTEGIIDALRAGKLSEDAIKNEIIKLATAVNTLETPTWMLQAKRAGSPGVPTLFLSDLHWGEVVEPKQINSVNHYDVKTAHERLQKLATRFLHLLGIISPEFDYPGMVLVLGGDMISGNIHDELTATNEFNTMPTVLDLYGELVRFIELCANQLGNVFIPCVSGNHGRDTAKIWNKDRHATSFDWLLYCFLAKHFEGDSRITFMIPDGPDAYYKVYNHRYLLSHGDQFRGGDGMIGALGPIIRGDHRKRSRNAQIDMEYDTLLIGHWHQYIQLNRLIVNGSLKGYDEYAYNNNFPFEVAQQALWITHPVYGITFRVPVKLVRQNVVEETPWVAIK